MQDTNETQARRIAEDELAGIIATAQRLFAEWESDCSLIRTPTGWDNASSGDRENFIRQAVRERALALALEAPDADD